MASQSYYPSPTPTSQNRQKKNTLIIILASAGAIVVVITIILISINAAYQNSAKLAEGIVTNPDAVQYYELSAEQSAVVAQYGHPDSFTITFYTEEFDPYYTGEVRDEAWRYYDEGVEYDFYNGSLMYTLPITDPPADWIALPYQPEQFTAYAGLDTILASAAISDLFELPLEKELIQKGKLYYAPGLTFGTVRDRLIYVETIMMAEGGG